MYPRMLSCIYLRGLDNIQGGHLFLNLNTGKTITRHHIEEVPITQEIIDVMENLGRNYGISPILVFTHKPFSTPDADNQDVQIAGVDDEEIDNEEHKKKEKKMRIMKKKEKKMQIMKRKGSTLPMN
jgi:hypothetical protein